jgi:methyl-accepting chemotaxis protein WspA
MQSSVTGGVMEMARFTEQVNQSVTDTNHISLRFGEIIQEVQTLLPQFDAVHEGMRSQSAGAKEIRDAMVTLTESVRVSAHALEQTTSATHRLEGAIDELRNEIALFKLG